MKVLSIYLFFLTILFSLHCKNENEEKQKTKRIFLYSSLYFLDMQNALTRCFDFQVQVSCSTVPVFLEHNLKAIQVYKNNALSFEKDMTNQGVPAGPCGSSEAYSVSFQNNNLSLESLSTYQINGNYCGVQLHFGNGIKEKYNMSFNGNVNTFTEFTVGEYRFVAVR